MIAEEVITWNRIQQKHAIAFEKYYKEQYKCFFLMACKYLRDPVLAEEIVNDVFVKIWTDADKIQIESSLKSYVYRAVINRSISLLNKNKKDLQNRQELSRHTDEAFEFRLIETNELEVRLYEAINQLPEQCRKVFRMSRFEELKQHEIANKLGISIKTVKNHITLALKRLNETVGDSIIVLLFVLKIFF